MKTPANKIEVHRKALIPWRMGAVFFNTGINVLTQSQYDLIKDNAMFVRQLETGAMKVLINGKQVSESDPDKVSEILRRQIEARRAKKAVQIKAQSEKESGDGEEKKAEGTLKVSESPLGSLNVKDAQVLIEASDSVEELRSWQEGEPRKTILNAIEEKIKELNANGAE